MAAAVLLASGVALAKPIQIRDATTANPYPAEITISGFPATSKIDDVNLELNAFTHTFPADVDVLLVGPTGRNAIVMSDAGIGLPVRNVNLVLDDEATNPLPSGAQITSGTYQPANYFAGDSFPAPAPDPSKKSALSVFNNTNPNGTWQLYMVDHAGGDTGRLGGWSLDITAT
jgi:subtilisin-like proprotein convertase family protein